MAIDTGLELDALLGRIHNNHAAMRQLVEMLLAHLPTRRAAVMAAVATADADALMRAAHALKGTLSNFTVGASWQLAGDLEDLGRADSLDGAIAAQAALETELDAVVIELHDWLARQAA
jgi:two-component system, sensor histidine kinase and response regulator